MQGALLLILTVEIERYPCTLRLEIYPTFDVTLNVTPHMFIAILIMFLYLKEIHRKSRTSTIKKADFWGGILGAAVTQAFKNWRVAGSRSAQTGLLRVWTGSQRGVRSPPGQRLCSLHTLMQRSCLCMCV